MAQSATSESKHSGLRRWVGFVQFFAIILIVAVALYFAQAPERIGSEQTVSVDEAPPVQIVTPVAAEHVYQLDLTGTVTLDRKLTVISEVVGRVVWVSPEFINGGQIPAHETIIRIDPREYEINVMAAEMAVEEMADRVRQMRNGAVTNADVSLDGMEARLRQAEANLDLMRLQLARTEISFPYAVSVISSELEVGDLVGPSDVVGRNALLGVVYRSEALQVRVPISVEELATLDPAIGRTATVDTVSGSYEAFLARVSSVVSPETRQAAVFLKFNAPNDINEALPVPGTFARVRISGPQRDNVFILPEAAARKDDQIWIVSDGVLQTLRPVTVGRSTEGWIVEAFDPGDGVVVSTISGASEGLRVTPSPAF